MSSDPNCKTCRGSGQTIDVFYNNTLCPDCWSRDLDIHGDDFAHLDSPLGEPAIPPVPNETTETPASSQWPELQFTDLASVIANIPDEGIDKEMNILQGVLAGLLMGQGVSEAAFLLTEDVPYLTDNGDPDIPDWIVTLSRIGRLELPWTSTATMVIGEGGYSFKLISHTFIGKGLFSPVWHPEHGHLDVIRLELEAESAPAILLLWKSM